jgi:hypothetical protein
MSFCVSSTMQVLRAVWAIGSVLVVSAACGPTDDSAGTSSEAFDPPPNIDAVVCSEITPVDTLSSECSDCCSDAGFSGATDYEERCVCGNPRDDTGQTACADQTAAVELCTTCCNDNGFSGYLWVGDDTCRCDGRSDAEVCAYTVERPEPAEACRVCCLNNGFLGMGYVGIGTPECNCVE